MPIVQPWSQQCLSDLASFQVVWWWRGHGVCELGTCWRSVDVAELGFLQYRYLLRMASERHRSGDILDSSALTAMISHILSSLSQQFLSIPLELWLDYLSWRSVYSKNHSATSYLQVCFCVRLQIEYWIALIQCSWHPDELCLDYSSTSALFSSWW